MKLQLKKSETSVILTVFIQDSSSTTGAGLSSLDQLSSIVGGYVKRDGTGIALAVDENVTTEGTYEAPTTAAQIRIGTPANMSAGVYELHLHNDLFTISDWVIISLGGATNMAPLLIEIQLTDVDLNDGIRAGLTSLPNAAADAAFGLPISDAGGLDLDTKLANTNEITVARMGALTDWIQAGRLDLILDIIAADVVNIDGAAMRGTDSASTHAPIDIVSAGAINTSAGAVSTVTDVSNAVTTDAPSRTAAQADTSLLATEAKQDIAQTDLDTITGTGVVATSVGVNGITATSIAADAINAAALKADAVTKITDDVWAELMEDITAIPSMTDSVLKGISLIISATRSKQTVANIDAANGTITLFKNDGITPLTNTQAINDDGTTFTRSKPA